MKAVTSTVAQSKTQTQCRVCGSASLFRYLDLGATPLANSYLAASQLHEPEFSEELALQVCRDCGLSQLTKVVHPDLMFRNYLYVSSTTQTFRDHCAEMAKTLTAAANCKSGDLVLDIASNDGCLLARFKEVGMSVVGVDPAVNLAREANAAGIRTINDYWSTSVAAAIARDIGKPKVITATNVFAHVDDVHGFVSAVSACMAERGLLAIECPYLLDFIERNEFDTAYHEHLSYVGITPVQRLMKQHGMEVCRVNYFPDLHGGTVRIYSCRAGDYPIDASVKQYLDREKAFGVADEQPYREFARRVLHVREKLLALLRSERQKGKVIWAYGASAKGNTLANFVGITSELVPAVVDDNPRKWDHYCPGSHMRIIGPAELASGDADYLVLLAWNFRDEIMRRARAAKYKGAFIVPVPDPEIVS